jgi:hypothetical protein
MRTALPVPCRLQWMQQPTTRPQQTTTCQSNPNVALPRGLAAAHSSRFVSFEATEMPHAPKPIGGAHRERAKISSVAVLV